MRKNVLLLLLTGFLACSNTTRAQVYDTLVPFGSVWKYLDDGSDQTATNWKLTSYSDATWKCGPAPLGYGDTWIVTCIQSGCVNDITCAPACGTKNITNWFRLQIDIPHVNDYDSVIMDALIDDGMAMYVNGTQVWVYNMPAAPYPYTGTAGWAPTTISGSAETTYVHQVIPMTGWVNGNNLVAVELHQRGPTSSDADLDVRMAFRGNAKASVNSISNSGTQFELFPNPSYGEFTIKTLDPSLSNANVNMTVLDITGRKIAEQNIEFADSRSNQNLKLKPGIYFISLVSDRVNATFRIYIEN